MHVPRLQDLFTDVLDVLEAVLAGDVVHQDVSSGAAQPVAAEVGPLVQRADREVRDVRTVDDAHLVQVFVDDYRRAEHLPQSQVGTGTTLESYWEYVRNER